MPTYVSTYLGTTTVQAFTCTSDGSPETFQNGKQFQLIFPEGLIYYAGDKNIKNSEYRINISGVEKTPEVIKPEYVNLTVDVNALQPSCSKQSRVRKRPSLTLLQMIGKLNLLLVPQNYIKISI